MRPTNTQSLSDILKDFLDDNPLLNEKMAETRALNAWEELLGAATAAYTSNVYIRNRVLYVHVSSAVLRSELTMCREKLTERLNEKAGMSVVDSIVLR